MTLAIYLLKDARCLVNLKPLYFPSAVEKVSGNITVIREQVGNLIGVCSGDHSHMTRES